MYELIILAFLMRNPMHGYLIARIINDIIGPFAKVSNGRLYPLLSKLEEAGLIEALAKEAGEQHDRRQRTFRVTEMGRERFHQLMMDTTSNPGEYSDFFWMKMPFFEFLRPTERLYLLDHYLNYCQTHIFHLTHEMEDLERSVARYQYMTLAQLEATQAAITHSLSLWQLELDHTRRLRSQELAQTEELPPTNVPPHSIIDEGSQKNEV